MLDWTCPTCSASSTKTCTAKNAALTRLRDQTSAEEHAYFVDIGHLMAGLPLPAGHNPPTWLDGEQPTRDRWRQFVIERRVCLRHQL
ncbi:hypothetical protein ACFVGN_39955 [Streptomyces sp. NPDC057757]|uniref:hypothetical protein n=1 Tax=Streptomyces sp. NPDC057757 TaxID=3346241 RepID=UPI0036A819CB